MNISEIFPPHKSREKFDPSRGRFRELHLYMGSFCNRKCNFCNVNGGLEGWSEPFTESTLNFAMTLIEADGNFKVYGGEPTTEMDNLTWAMNCLRKKGFEGWFTIFSNGVLADRIISILEFDTLTEIVLNYSILYGRDAEPIPEDSKSKLTSYALRNPNRIFSSHRDLVPVERGANFIRNQGHLDFGSKCPKCHPVLTTQGLLHACPFAVEIRKPHYVLGSMSDSGDLESQADVIMSKYKLFLRWIDGFLTPKAEIDSRHPCSVCTSFSPDT